MHPVRIGTAGWSIPRQFADEAPQPGSHLERYARVLSCAEINSSFYRPHRASTWARWAESVPENFQFSVKAPKTITHEAQLSGPPDPVRAFLSDVAHLGEKLGPILFQLPPSAAFDPDIAERFLNFYRDIHQGSTVFEPRHRSWFTQAAEELFERFRIVRVTADPPIAPGTEQTNARAGMAYYRLHGAPRVYYSDYSVETLEALADKIVQQKKTAEVWCIFDNTALGHAFGNALWLRERLSQAPENIHRFRNPPAVL